MPGLFGWQVYLKKDILPDISVLEQKYVIKIEKKTLPERGLARLSLLLLRSEFFLIQKLGRAV